MNAFWAIIVVLAAARSPAAAGRSLAEECSGCAGAVLPIKGSDGLTYINECVARCSGAKVASVGAEGRLLSRGLGRTISRGVMLAHAAEGFRFISFDRLQTTGSTPDLSKLPSDRVVRYDAAHGAVYASAAPATIQHVAPAGSYSSPHQALLLPSQAADSSSHSTGSSSGNTPGAAIGQLLSYGQKWHCTATLVAEHTVLTAASCVFDRQRGSLNRGLYFVPGRYRAADGKVVAPYGAADVAEVFLLSSFVTSSTAADAAASDIAVVWLQRNANFGNAIRPMAVMATAAAQQPEQQQQQQQQQPIAASRRLLLAPTSTSSSTYSTSLLLTGYPNSEAEGTRVVTKCQLQQQLQQQQQPSAVMQLGCTTRVGEAGAPLYTAQGVVVGVAAGVQQQQQPSAGVAITPAIWHTLLMPYVV